MTEEERKYYKDRAYNVGLICGFLIRQLGGMETIHQDYKKKAKKASKVSKK